MSSPAYLLTGEPFLAEEALAKLRAEVGADPLSEVVLDAAAPVNEISSALETPSLLGGRRLVVIHEGEALKKDQVDYLAGYLESPSEHSVLVVVASGRTKLADALKGAGETVSLDAPRGRRLVSWLRQRAGVHGLQLDERAAWALMDAVGTALRDLDGALSQLSTALGPETRAGVDEVQRVFARLADERVYAFTDAVGDRRLPTAMAALRRLLEQGDEPLMILGALAAQVRRLLVARSVGGDPRTVRDALGLQPWRAERICKQARSYREEELAAALVALAKADIDMKSGELPDPRLALERTVISIIT
ncbi:MAG: DNA polymerase III subunit delta [Actinomycetota bacterium]